MTEVKWHVAQTACPHILKFPKINSIRQGKINEQVAAENWKSRTTTSNPVILSIYIHTHSHTIWQMACLPLMKTENKLYVIDVLINWRWQK